MSPVRMMTGISRSSCLAQLRGDLEPVHTVRQIVVGQDKIGSDHPSRHQLQRRDAVGRRRYAWPSSSSSSSSSSRTSGIVLDDQDRCRCGRAVRRCRRPCRAGRVRGCGPDALGVSVTSMAKTEPLPGSRTDPDAVAQQIRPDAARWTDRGRGRGFARARRCRAGGTPRRSPEVPRSGMPMPVSQTSMLSIRPRRRQPSSTLPRLVYFSAFESRLRIICSSRRGSLRIESAARDHTQGEALRLRVIGELVPQPVKQIVDREVRPFRRGRCRPRSG